MEPLYESARRRAQKSAAPDFAGLPKIPELEGMFKKLKTNAKFLSSWNKRYFAIEPFSRSLFYAPSKGKTPSLHVPLEDILEVRRFDDFKFEIKSKKRNFFLKSDDGTKVDVWVTELQRYIRQLLAHDQYQKKLALARKLRPNSAEENNNANDVPVKPKGTKTILKKSTPKREPPPKPKVFSPSKVEDGSVKDYLETLDFSPELKAKPARPESKIADSIPTLRLGPIEGKMCDSIDDVGCSVEEDEVSEEEEGELASPPPVTVPCGMEPEPDFVTKDWDEEEEEEDDEEGGCRLPPPVRAPPPSGMRRSHSTARAMLSRPPMSRAYSFSGRDSEAKIPEEIGMDKNWLEEDWDSD